MKNTRYLRNKQTEVEDPPTINLTRNLVAYDRVLLEDKKRDVLQKIAKAKQGSRNDLKDIPKKSWESPTEKRREERQNETDHKIADAAGVSEDTVRKVRNIRNYATARWQDGIF